MTDPTKHLLFVEDESALREAIAEQLSDRGYQVEQADSGEAALERLADFAFDIIITDLRLPGIDGSSLVQAAVERYPDIIAIVVTGYGTMKDAVEVIKRGAWDFVSKPFQIDELLHVLDAALEQRRLKSENAYLRAQLEERDRFEGIVGKSRAMTRLVQLLENIAATSTDLGRMVAEGHFREDLFYRLNVIPVELPPLRDRKEDIPLLVQHFLEKFRAARIASASERSASPAGERLASTAPLTVSQEAMRRLMAYQWPGNVRQLENAIERATAFTAGRSQIDLTDLPPELQQAQEPPVSAEVSLPEDGLDFEAYIAKIQRTLIERSLERTGGNKGQAGR